MEEYESFFEGFLLPLYRKHQSSFREDHQLIHKISTKILKEGPTVNKEGFHGRLFNQNPTVSEPSPESRRHLGTQPEEPNFQRGNQ